MKKTTFLFALSCIVGMAAAQKPTSYWSKTAFKSEAQNITAAASQSEATIVLEEDFSLFTAGSEDMPDKNISIEEESDKAMKVIEEGQLLIIYKGNKYNILGNR